MHPLSLEPTVALMAVRAAGRVCARVQSGIAPETLEKKDKSPVTVADFASQAVVCWALNDFRPSDPVIAEEDAAALRDGEAGAALLAKVVDAVNAPAGEPWMTPADALAAIDHGGASEFSPRFWTLDPIDGTKGFLRGGQYAVSLALVIAGRVEVAAVGCPNLSGPGDAAGAIFVGRRGDGVFAHDFDGGRSPLSGEPISVSTTADPAAARFCESVESGHSDHDASTKIAADLGITAEPVRMDSQAKYCAVARGEADIYLRLPTRPGYVERIWDHAGGAFLVEQAGGKVTDVDGKPLDFTCGSGLENNRGVVATNGLLHDRVLAAVAAAGV